MTRGRRVQGLSKHQPARLLQSKLFLILQRAHGRDGLETMVERRRTHARFARYSLDPEWRRVIPFEPTDRTIDRHHPVIGHCDLSQAVSIFAGKQTVENLPLDER